MKRAIGISNGVLWLLFAVAALIVIQMFFEFGLPSLRGDIPVALYSDTLTYERIATGELYVSDIISFNANLFGPPLLFDMLGHSRIAVLFFNLFVAAISIYYLISREEVLRFRFFVLMITSMLFLFSFFGLNKEIIILPVCVFVYNYVKGGSFWFIVFAILLSFLIRWQMVMFCLLVAVFFSVGLFNKNRLLFLFTFLMLVSVVIGFQSDGILAHMNEVAKMGALEEVQDNAGGLFPRMLQIQQSFGYFLVVVPKTLQLFFGLIVRFDPSLMLDQFWNYFVIMMQSIQNLVLLVIVFLRRQMRIGDDTFLLIVLYCICFAATPIFGPRYLYPVTLWAIFMCCQKRKGNLRPRGRTYYPGHP